MLQQSSAAARAMVVSQSFLFRGGPEYVSIVSELVKGS
jgi:hypothetical protein